jgi:hypothetical protein
MQFGDCASLFRRDAAGADVKSCARCSKFLPHARATRKLEEFPVKSAMIVAALCAGLLASTPVAVQAKGPTDVQLYCTFFPFTAKCAPAKPAAAAPAARPAVVAAAKPAVKPAAFHIKTMQCAKAPAGAGHLYSCSWK